MKQALSGPDAERWKASMEKELTIEKMGVWRHPTFQRENFRYHVSLSITQTFERRMYIGMEILPLRAWKLIKRMNQL